MWVGDSQLVAAALRWWRRFPSLCLPLLCSATDGRAATSSPMRSLKARWGPQRSKIQLKLVENQPSPSLAPPLTVLLQAMPRPDLRRSVGPKTQIGEKYRNPKSRNPLKFCGKLLQQLCSATDCAAASNAATRSLAQSLNARSDGWAHKDQKKKNPKFH